MGTKAKAEDVSEGLRLLQYLCSYPYESVPQMSRVCFVCNIERAAFDKLSENGFERHVKVQPAPGFTEYPPP